VTVFRCSILNTCEVTLDGSHARAGDGSDGLGGHAEGSVKDEGVLPFPPC
jgi:hypothetical protein